MNSRTYPGNFTGNTPCGQKQRAAIARALMGDPRIILADGPAGALDRANSTESMELLQGWPPGGWWW